MKPLLCSPVLNSYVLIYPNQAPFSPLIKNQLTPNLQNVTNGLSLISFYMLQIIFQGSDIPPPVSKEHKGVLSTGYFSDIFRKQVFDSLEWKHCGLWLTYSSFLNKRSYFLVRILRLLSYVIQCAGAGLHHLTYALLESRFLNNQRIWKLFVKILVALKWSWSEDLQHGNRQILQIRALFFFFWELAYQHTTGLLLG